MTSKKQLQDLARTDNIDIRFSGKTKTAFANFKGAINAGHIQKYRGLFADIGNRR